MRRLTLLGTVVAMLVMALPGSALAGKPGAGTCSGGMIPAGTYSGFTVTGNCAVDFDASVQINGNLTVADGAILNDHGAEGFHRAQMHITGNVRVGKGAILGLGYNAAEGTLGPDTVGGNIVANQPLTLYLGNITVGGNVISNGGGLLSNSLADFRNFPIKDNTIHGNLIIQGHRGGWIGLIRNHVDGNVVFAKNVSRSNPETGPGTDGDSSEVMGSAFGPVKLPQTIGGNLICHGNVPAAQINFADGGDYNVVGGHKIGECAGL